MRHLYSNECHDESQVWCGDDDYYRDLVAPTRDPIACDCVPCLTNAKRFGDEATARLRALRPKDWSACPYAAHADDCDCGGAGGDQ